MDSITPSVAATTHSLEALKDKRTQREVSRNIGARIRARRAIAGISQTELGEAMGLTFQQIQKYERGSNRISAPRLYQMARVLNVSLAWFFEDLDSSQPSGLTQTTACIQVSRLVQSVEPETQRQILAIVRRVVTVVRSVTA